MLGASLNQPMQRMPRHLRGFADDSETPATTSYQDSNVDRYAGISIGSGLGRGIYQAAHVK